MTYNAAHRSWSEWFRENVMIARILLDTIAYRLKATKELFQTFAGSQIISLDKTKIIHSLQLDRQSEPQHSVSRMIRRRS